MIVWIQRSRPWPQPTVWIPSLTSDLPYQQTGLAIWTLGWGWLSLPDLPCPASPAVMLAPSTSSHSLSCPPDSFHQLTVSAISVFFCHVDGYSSTLSYFPVCCYNLLMSLSPYQVWSSKNPPSYLISWSFSQLPETSSQQSMTRELMWSACLFSGSPGLVVSLHLVKWVNLIFARDLK